MEHVPLALKSIGTDVRNSFPIYVNVQTLQFICMLFIFPTMQPGMALLEIGSAAGVAALQINKNTRNAAAKASPATEGALQVRFLKIRTCRAFSSSFF